MIKRKRNNEFIEKLVDILKVIKQKVQNHPQGIRWDSTGKAIIIQSRESLQTVVLPKYFRHRNYDSFIRQLNMYRFKKSIENGIEHYRNELFRLGNEDNFYKIQRENNIKARQKTKLHKMTQRTEIDCAIRDLVNKLVTFQYLSKRKTQNMKNIVQDIEIELQRTKSAKVKSSIQSLKSQVEKIGNQIEDVETKYRQFLADCFGKFQVPTQAKIEIFDKENFFEQREQMEQLIRPQFHDDPSLSNDFHGSGGNSQQEIQ